jgi:hypothetical protein
MVITTPPRRLDFSRSSARFAWCIISTPFYPTVQMRLITIFVLPFLLAGQGMIHCVLTKCCEVTYVDRSGSGLEHRRWWSCRQHFTQ